MTKISFVCTTYRRFTCVERIIAQFYAQTHPNKELIIYNTDTEYPMELGFAADDIVLVNNDIDYQTGLPYTNRGQICRDAVTHATGEYFMLADDDDVYLPWHMHQAYEKITNSNKDAWKPERSFFATKSAIMLVQNTLEASVIVKMNRIREIGFRMDLTGYEGLSWYTKLRDEQQLVEHDQYYVPSYCFNWTDPHEIAGHKQSGDINNPDNFENHKRESKDYATAPLVNTTRLDTFYAPYYEFLDKNRQQFSPDLLERYVVFPPKNA